MKKFLYGILVLFSFLTISAVAAPPSPETFLANRSYKPKAVLLSTMRSDISDGVRKVIYIWNLKYSRPLDQIADLIVVFRGLSNASNLPKQILLNKSFYLDDTMNVDKIVYALDDFKNDTAIAYEALFEYSRLVVGSKTGDVKKSYNRIVREMNSMVRSYNSLAKVVNREYRAKVMPYYQLDNKKRSFW